MNVNKTTFNSTTILLIAVVMAIVVGCSGNVIAKAEKSLDVECYTDDWKRTNPDIVVYAPPLRLRDDGYNDHFLVTITPGGDYLAIWTQGGVEAAEDLRVVYAHSTDKGLTWSKPKVLAEDETKQGLVCTFGFPVVSKKGRIYCFYNKHRGIGWHYSYGVMRVKYSDDDGHTWIDGEVDIYQQRTRFDHPDPKMDCMTIPWQIPIRDSKGRLITGITRHSSLMVYPRPIGGNRWHMDRRCELIRFDNIDENPEPKDIKITWLPDEKGSIAVSPQIEPEASRGYSLAVEPCIVLLPDGRLFMTIRTVTGQIWYTVSDDDGHNWRKPEIMRYRDNGRAMLHPKAPCPIYKLKDGRFIIFYNNHDGHFEGATGPWDMDARRPIYYAVGEFRGDANQPIWFSEPKFFADTQKVGIGQPRWFWLVMSGSLTEDKGRCIYWYPDRKHFLLGRYITDEMLADMKVPE